MEHEKACMEKGGEGEREREREKEYNKRHCTPSVRAGTARRAKGVGNRRACGPVRTTTDYIDFDFRRRAHLALSGSVHSCHFRLATTEDIGPVPRAKEDRKKMILDERAEQVYGPIVIA